MRSGSAGAQHAPRAASTRSCPRCESRSCNPVTSGAPSHTTTSANPWSLSLVAARSHSHVSGAQDALFAAESMPWMRCHVAGRVMSPLSCTTPVHIQEHADTGACISQRHVPSSDQWSTFSQIARDLVSPAPRLYYRQGGAFPEYQPRRWPSLGAPSVYA